MTPQVSQKIEEIHIAHCNSITDESIECILLNSKKIKYLLFHSCPNVTGTYLNKKDRIFELNLI
jgi:hypothetical protein